MITLLEYINKTRKSVYTPDLNKRTEMRDIYDWLLDIGYTQMDAQNGIYNKTKTLMSYDKPVFISSSGDTGEMWEGEYLYIYNGRASHLLEIDNITNPTMKSLQGTRYKWINDRGIYDYEEKDYDVVNNYITLGVKTKK